MVPNPEVKNLNLYCRETVKSHTGVLLSSLLHMQTKPRLSWHFGFTKEKSIFIHILTVVGLERGPLSLVRIIEELLE
jgi:hypothetical protein